MEVSSLYFLSQHLGRKVEANSMSHQFFMKSTDVLHLKGYVGDSRVRDCFVG